MGTIVFSTIIENIKSFFAQEETLSVQPKTLPEAASEVYEKPQGQVPQQRIIEKPLPQSSPRLPFSPEELRSALNMPAPKPEVRQEIAPQPVYEHRSIDHEIVAFETALQDAHRVTPLQRTSTPAPTTFSIPVPQVQPLQKSFFDEFNQFMVREDLEAEDLLEKDILWRMKEFHRHRQEGKEYYLYSKDVQGAVQRKLGELKGLEQEWFGYREQSDQLEKQLHFLEAEIQSKASDMKQLLLQARAKSRLERSVPPNGEFVLKDGRTLRSLLDLKIALHSMTEETFSYHVTPSRNDFASWVHGAYNNPDLAAELEKIKDKAHMEMFLGKLDA